jgi:hypothetical protein
MRKRSSFPPALRLALEHLPPHLPTRPSAHAGASDLPEEHGGADLLATPELPEEGEPDGAEDGGDDAVDVGNGLHAHAIAGHDDDGNGALPEAAANPAACSRLLFWLGAR